VALNGAPARAGRVAVAILAAALLAALLPVLCYDLARVARATPIDYVEGWNAYHAARVMNGEALYRPVASLPLTPVNYPPLSFYLVAGLARATGSVLLSGRLLSLAALAAATALLALAVRLWTGSRASGVLAAAVWLGLLTRFGGPYVGSHEPQMLGHALCALAVCLYAAWEDAPSPGRVAALAALCSLALFTKHLLLAVPAALALVLLIRERRLLPVFALTGLGSCALFALATWRLAGGAVIANWTAFDRLVRDRRLADELTALFLDGRLGLAAAAIALLAVVGGRGSTFATLYAASSLVLGSVAIRGVGVDRNAWFDAFLAIGMTLGLLAARAAARRGVERVALLGLVVAASVLPLAAGLPERWRDPLDDARLGREEAAYLADVALLRRTPGPALFEEPLMGYDAGKEFLFDPFGGSLAMVSGRAPESLLLDPIRRREFGAIVLTSPLSRWPARSGAGAATQAPPRLRGWWTRNVLEAVRENYDPYDPGRRRFGHFYFPKGGDGVGEERTP
jgi:hypothetical protein